MWGLGLPLALCLAATVDATAEEAESCAAAESASAGEAFIQIRKVAKASQQRGAKPFQVDPVPEGKDSAISGLSLYCFMAVVPDSSEMVLLSTAKDNGGGVFGCDETSVYEASSTDMTGWDAGAGGASVVNVAAFANMMQQVQEDGLYSKHDWSVKADADCVFLPDRLRSHLWGLRPPANVPIYVKTSDLVGNGGFVGSIEVFSREAMNKFMDNQEDCFDSLGFDSGGDGSLTGCMDAIGVGFILDRELSRPNFDPATCTNGAYAAYHPMKYKSHWQRCWDIATGKMCQGLTYDCGGELDPPLFSVGIR